jgi:hypothetical protein
MHSSQVALNLTDPILRPACSNVSQPAAPELPNDSNDSNKSRLMIKPWTQSTLVGGIGRLAPTPSAHDACHRIEHSTGKTTEGLLFGP